MKLELDTRKAVNSRLLFLQREEESEWSSSVILTKEVPHCRTHDVYLIVSMAVLTGPVV